MAQLNSAWIEGRGRQALTSDPNLTVFMAEEAGEQVDFFRLSETSPGRRWSGFEFFGLDP